MKNYNIALVGATGLVGRMLLELLETRQFPVNRIKLLAGERSANTVLNFNGAATLVNKLSEDSFEGIDLAFFTAGRMVSADYIPNAVMAGAVVIDNSSQFRMDPAVPLVVPEVNPEALEKHKGIIANPNCSTIQMLVALKPLHDAARIKRIVATTFQSVSGAGKSAIDELLTQIYMIMEEREKEHQVSVFPHQIAFNCIPHIGDFDSQGNTFEENKMINETQKILDPDIRVCATCVRVPVMIGHCEAVNIETENKITAEEAREILANAPGVAVIDDVDSNEYPLPVDCVSKDDVLVGRIREDESIENGLTLWIVSDNLIKGAALNAVQIAETMLRKGLV